MITPAIDKLPFTDKASYLAWRAQWKADYKAITQTIRDLKFARYWASRTSSLNGTLPLKDWKTVAQMIEDKAVLARVTEINTKAQAGRYWLGSMSYMATLALAERKQSKIQAQEQYLAQKVTQAA